MANYNVFISLKDSSDNFISNSDAIAFFSNMGYNSLSADNTYIVSDSTQVVNSDETKAVIIIALKKDSYEITSEFDIKGFDSAELGTFYDEIDELKTLNINQLPGYAGDMDDISSYEKIVAVESSAFGYFINDDDTFSFNITISVSGSSTPTVSYTAGEDFTVTPESPLSISGETDLVVSLIDGYSWDNVDQQINIDGNILTGVVDNGNCTFTLTTSNVGSGGEITWDLHYTAVVPPSEDRVDFFTIYAPTNKNMDTINNSIFISGSGTSDIMKYFSSYKKFFVNIPIDGYKELKASQYDFGETAPYIKSHTIDVDCGSVEIEETFQSLLDYSPFSRLTIYLPFIGFEDVDLAMVMGHNLKVQYKVDVLSGRCLAKLYTDSVTPESCIAEYGGTIAADEIFGLNSGYQYYGSYELMTTLQLGELQPYLLLSSKIPLEDSIADYEGLPTNEIIKVGDAIGFIKYSSIHVEGITATDVEKSEIESLLKSGIVV